MAPVLEGKSINLDQKTVLKGELLIWRTKNKARGPRYSPNQGVQLLQIRKLDPGLPSKVGLSYLQIH
jgi:hypothetical protein